MVLTCPQSRAACQCGGWSLTRRQTGRPAARRCWVEGCLQQHTAGTGTDLQGHHTLPLVSLFVFKTWMIASTGLNNKVFDDEKSVFYTHLLSVSAQWTCSAGLEERLENITNITTTLQHDTCTSGQHFSFIFINFLVEGKKGSYRKNMTFEEIIFSL